MAVVPTVSLGVLIWSFGAHMANMGAAGKDIDAGLVLLQISTHKLDLKLGKRVAELVHRVFLRLPLQI